jgi:hypothetical protein
MQYQYLIRDIYNQIIPFKIRNSIYQQTKLKHYCNERKSLNGDQILKSFDKYKCIFIHIPKTGGISIKKSAFGYSSLPHLTAADYRIIFNDKTYENYFTFAFVRNPWDRVFSAYRFLKKGGCTRRDRYWSEANLALYKDFESFVCQWLNYKNIYTHVHFIPQCEFICNAKGEIDVNFLGRFENLAEEFDKIMTKLDIKVELKHLNKTSKISKNYRDYYTEKTSAVVAKIYQRDIELFDYKF